MITSRQNGSVQWLRKLCGSAKLRRERGEFVGAGSKLLEDYRAAGGSCRELYTAAELAPELMSYVTGMQSAPDCVFIGEMSSTAASVSAFERVLVLEDMQDPGNVGTMIRCAAAFGLDAVVLAGECANPWQLKTLRGSMGAVFRVALLECESAAEVAAEIPLISAVAHGGEDVRTFKFPQRFALAIGNEGHGLRQSTLERSSALLYIPISAASESLNAASAASILLWEAMRMNA